MPNIDEAIEALLAYQQADMEGVMVLTSRQAIHEVADEIARLRASLQPATPVEAARARKPVAWRVDGKRGGEPQVWFYWKPEWPTMHEKQGDKVTPLYDDPAQPSQQLREAVAAAHAAFQAIPIGYPIQQNGRTIDHTLLNEAKRLCEEAMAMTSTDRAEPGWSAVQFWEYVEGLTDAHVMGQIRDMLSSQGLSVSRQHREAGQ